MEAIAGKLFFTFAIIGILGAMAVLSEIEQPSWLVPAGKMAYRAAFPMMALSALGIVWA
jgi:hypothetical protein